jgi:glyoxylase I family protein
MAIALHGVWPLLQVFDMPTSLRFYRDVLGFRIKQTAPSSAEVEGDDFGWVWLTHGDVELMLNTAYDPDDVRPETPDAARVASHGDTSLFIGCPDVEELHRHVVSCGVEADPPVVTGYGMHKLEFRDPDGYLLCFQWSLPAINPS